MSRKFFAKIEEYAFLRFCQGHSNMLQASEYSRKMSNFASGFRSCFHSKNISSKSKQLLNIEYGRIESQDGLHPAARQRPAGRIHWIVRQTHHATRPRWSGTGCSSRRPYSSYSQDFRKSVGGSSFRSPAAARFWASTGFCSTPPSRRATSPSESCASPAWDSSPQSSSP